MTDLCCKLLQRTPDDCHSGEKLRMSVPLEYLSRHRSRLEPEFPANVFLNLWAQVFKRSNRSRNLPNRDFLNRSLESVDIPSGLIIPKSKLQPERCRLG